MKSINMGDDKKEKIMIVHGEHKDDVWLLGTSVKDMGRSSGYRRYCHWT